MEALLQETGPCGPFQVGHALRTEMCRFVSTFAIYLMVFGLYNPGWRCLGVNNASAESNNRTLPQGTGHPPEQWQTSGHPAPAFSTSTNSERGAGNESRLMATFHFNVHYNYNGTCGGSDWCEAVEFDPSSSTIVTEFGLHCDQVWVGHLIVSVMNGGQLAGNLFWGQFAERFGRKPSLYLGMAVAAVPSGVAVFSPSWEAYALFSFIIGFGCSSVPTTASILNTEFLDASWRARLASVPVLNLGTVFFALATFVLRDWRYVHLATAFIMAVTCLGYFWTPESLRWLTIHGKVAEAHKVVRRIAVLNKKPISQARLDQTINKDEGNAESKGNKHYTYLDLFRTREIRLLTIKLGIIRIVSLFVYEMIGFAVQSLPGDFYTNIVLTSLADLPLAVSRGPLANKVGRRYSGVLFGAIAVLSSSALITALVAMDDGQLRAALVTGMALVLKSATHANLGIHALSVVELMPTAVRTVSFGLSNTVTRVISIAGPFMLPTNGPSTVAFFGLFLVFQSIATIVYFLLPETKDQPLKDTMPESNENLSSKLQIDRGNVQIAIISFKRLD